MKQKYMKPAIVMEQFELSQSIAESCGAVNSSLGDPNLMDKHTCGWDVGFTVVWLDTNNACVFPQEDYVEFQGVCYNNPSGHNTIFSSY